MGETSAQVIVLSENESSEPSDDTSNSESEDEWAKWRKAGVVAKDALAIARKMIEPGTKVLDIVEAVEEHILEHATGIAFPCNVALNHVAAHYTSPLDDETVIEEGDLVTIDCGAHIDGCISDSAFTVALNPDHEDLVKASRDATNVAIKMMRPGAKLNTIGALIEDTIQSAGFEPIKQLSGHQLQEYELHSDKQVPCVSGKSEVLVEEGEVYAIETFASTGSGNVGDLPNPLIYQLLPIRVPVRFRGSKKFLAIARRKYQEFPFAERWMAKEMKNAELRMAIRELKQNGALIGHNILAEEKGELVSQHEHTVIITEDGYEQTT
ncbi:type II methionyl aminopeptidase [Candidatus Thorarchaeota archaeon]|nr:MAG: type II methionyl aminopeptidase [Candidatus Thorarchaeota archaeon]